MPLGGDLALYDARRDWGSEGDARRAFYDLLRDSDMSHDQAQHYSELGAQQFAADQAGELRAGPPDDRRPRQRYRTPHFGPHRGQLCRVLEDGSLEPVAGDAGSSPAPAGSEPAREGA